MERGERQETASPLPTVETVIPTVQGQSPQTVDKHVTVQRQSPQTVDRHVTVRQSPTLTTDRTQTRTSRTGRQIRQPKMYIQEC